MHRSVHRRILRARKVGPPAAAPPRVRTRRQEAWRDAAVSGLAASRRARPALTGRVTFVASGAVTGIPRVPAL